LKSVPLKDFFDEYGREQFSKTRLHVKMFQFGERFVSRSEAKRITQGLEKFESVILDFRGVEWVGQGFVDEVFRVWAGRHPRTRLEPVNMSEAVGFMIKRGLPIDPLTGIANRRSAMDALEREVRNAHEHHSSLTVAVFDIDRIKAINDTHGHLIADKVLRRFAHLLVAKARREDLVARVGEEEFLCILPGQTREEGLQFVERVAEALNAIVLENGIRWTVSAGVATLSGEESADSLVSRADEELLRLRRESSRPSSS
jgi:diguanylate cyclase (GGDEF)-like protein